MAVSCRGYGNHTFNAVGGEEGDVAGLQRVVIGTFR